MTEIDIEISTGRVVTVPVPITAVDVTPVNGSCKLYGWSFRDASGDTTQQAENSVTSPGAGAAIVSITGLATGTYDVSWTVALQGAAAAADANNFQLRNGVTVVEGSVNPGAAGVYPQVNARIVVPAGGTVSVNAIAAGTLGVVYLAQIEVAITLIPNAVCELLDAGNVLGVMAMPAGEANTEWLDEPGVHVQNQVRVHLISGTVRGCIYVKYVDVTPSWPLSGYR